MTQGDPEPLTPRFGFTVTLVAKTAMSQRGLSVDIEWPMGLPLPVAGDRIVHGEIGGYVGGTEYHPADRRVILTLR